MLMCIFRSAFFLFFMGAHELEIYKHFSLQSAINILLDIWKVVYVYIFVFISLLNGG